MTSTPVFDSVRTVWPRSLSQLGQGLAELALCALALCLPITNAGSTIALLAYLVGMLFAARGHAVSWRQHWRQWRSLWLFLLWYALAGLYSVAEAAELAQALKKISRLLLVPLIAHSCQQTPKLTKQVISCLAIGMALTLSVIAGKWLGWLAQGAFYPRHTVAFKDTIYTGLFLALTAYGGLLASHAWPRFKWGWRAITGVCLFFLYYYGIGRTGQVVFLGLYAWYVWRLYPGVWPKLGALGCLVGLLALCVVMGGTVVERQQKVFTQFREYQTLKHQLPQAEITQLQTKQSASIGMRLVFMENSWHLIQVKPWLGWGPGAFRTAYLQHAPEAQMAPVTRENPHNQYLLTWVETGAIGLILLIVWYRDLWQAVSMRSKWVALCGQGVLLALWLGCLANSWWLDGTSCLLFVLLIGVVLGAGTQPRLDAKA